MRLESALFASKEGLTASGQAIGVIGDNIANANTVGYKANRYEFADLLADGADGYQTTAVASSGSGVKLSAVRQVNEDGVLEQTGRNLDFGIQGPGYFVLTKDGSDDQFYSRAGNFVINESGQLANSDGYIVQGYSGIATDTLGPIDMLNSESVITPSSILGIFGNLNSSDPVSTPPTDPQTFQEISASANFIVEINPVDSLGGSHKAIVAFFKTDVGTWTARSYIDGADVGQTAKTPVQIGSDATLSFNASGVIEPANEDAAKIAATPAYSNGATAGAFSIDLSGISQRAAISNTTGLTNDGQGTGSIVAYSLTADGKILATLNTGNTTQVGSIALTNFTNVDSLKRIGSTLYQQSEGVGEQTVGVAGSAGFGTVSNNSLELSSVDTASQFISLVLLQRQYQANSQTLSVSSKLLQDTLALMR